VSHLAYRLGRAIVFPFAACFEIHVSGRHHLPAAAPCLLAANHISHFDPPLLSAQVGRDVDFMASAEFFSHSVPRAILTALNAFPIDRSRRDLSAVKTSMTRLERGRCVGVFVEGGIRHGARSVLEGAPLGAGSTALAQVASVPIVPCVILGTDQLYQWRAWFRRPRLFFAFGPPLHPQPDEDRRELARRLGGQMRTLLAGLRDRHGITDQELPRSAQERWREK